MKQKMATGAIWMTMPISFIATSNTPSIASFSTAVRRVWTSSRPIPKNRAKNITARMSLLLIALMTLEGTIAISWLIPSSLVLEALTMLAAPSPLCASICRAAAGSTPSPGRRTLTHAMLTSTAIEETTTV